MARTTRLNRRQVLMKRDLGIAGSREAPCLSDSVKVQAAAAKRAADKEKADRWAIRRGRVLVEHHARTTRGLKDAIQVHKSMERQCTGIPQTVLDALGTSDGVHKSIYETFTYKPFYLGVSLGTFTNDIEPAGLLRQLAAIARQLDLEHKQLTPKELLEIAGEGNNPHAATDLMVLMTKFKMKGATYKIEGTDSRVETHADGADHIVKKGTRYYGLLTKRNAERLWTALERFDIHAIEKDQTDGNYYHEPKHRGEGIEL